MFVYPFLKYRNAENTLIFRLGTLGSNESVKRGHNVTYQLQKHPLVSYSAAYVIRKGYNTDLYSQQVYIVP